MLSSMREYCSRVPFVRHRDMPTPPHPRRGRKCEWTYTEEERLVCAVRGHELLNVLADGGDKE